MSNAKNKQKAKKKKTASSSERKSLFLARFLRYYFHFLVLLILFLIGDRLVFLFGFSLSYIFYGSYYLYMTIKLPHHFILLMLDYDRKDMKNAKSCYPPAQIKEWKHDARILGLTSIIAGIGFILLSIPDI